MAEHARAKERTLLDPTTSDPELAGLPVSYTAESPPTANSPTGQDTPVP
jgi:hypothetical protein